MRGLEWKVVLVLLTLLGGISTVFAVADKFVQTREYTTYQQLILERLVSIDKRLEALENESKVPGRR